MADIEKVIKGLPCLTGVPIYCETCPYSDEFGFGYGNRRCAKECASDAIALLKEQEAVEPKVIRMNEFGYPVHACGKCGLLITESMNYCHECGKRIKWEGR